MAIEKENAGFKSRKFVLVVLSMLLITAVAVATIWAPAINVIYTTFCGTIVSLITIFTAGNAGIRYIYSKAQQNPQEPQSK